MLSSNTSSTCPVNMVNFGPLTAEIGSGVWGTPYKFQRVLRHDAPLSVSKVDGGSVPLGIRGYGDVIYGNLVSYPTLLVSRPTTMKSLSHTP